MTKLLLNHWKAKFVALLVAIAVWYVLKGHVRFLDQRNVVSDPGTQIAAAAIPGTPWCVIAALSTEVALVASERPQAELRRMRWVESGLFSASVVEFPAYRCA